MWLHCMCYFVLSLFDVWPECRNPWNSHLRPQGQQLWSSEYICKEVLDCWSDKRSKNCENVCRILWEKVWKSTKTLKQTTSSQVPTNLLVLFIHHHTQLGSVPINNWYVNRWFFFVFLFFMMTDQRTSYIVSVWVRVTLSSCNI